MLYDVSHMFYIDFEDFFSQSPIYFGSNYF
jgi:hypothetical protein